MEGQAKSYAHGTWATTRRLFLMGFAGLIIAIAGFTWLAIGRTQIDYQVAQKHIQSVQKLAQYSGTWVNEKSVPITRLKINSNGLGYTVDAFDSVGELGSDSGTFSSEPITATIGNLKLTMILNNAEATRLQVTVNNDVGNFTYIFDKSGS